jgi:hypothetical protein
MLLLLGHWWWRLSQKLVQPWISRSLLVLARDALAEPINLILPQMSRKRKRDASGEYLVWIGTLVLRFLLLKKCMCLNLLTLTPMGVLHLLLIPMGVLHLLLTPMGVLHLLLIPVVDVACVAGEDDGEEEDEVPLTRKNSRQCVASGESSGVPSPALSALIGLQELSLANFDQTLEDMVPEDLLSEPADDGVMEVCADVLDAGLRSSRASSTLERGLEGQETDLDHLGPMEVTEGPSALEAATAENLVLKGGVDTCPAPEDVAGDDSARVGSTSHYPAPEGTAGDDPAQVDTLQETHKFSWA